MEPQKTESIRLWVRSEPFELGTLPLSPHSKLIPKYLKRIVPYAKGQGESGFPELSYSVWRHIACNKLQLTEDLAWLYFEQYNLVHLKKAPERIELDKMKLGYSGELADLTRKTQSVDLLRFVLLLFVQHIHKVNLCTSSTSSLWEDRWPVETKRDLSPIMSEEQKQLNFVWSRLEEMIEILQDNCDDIGVEGEVVDALGLVIEGSSGFDNSSVVPLKGLTSQNENHAAAGYLKATQSYCFKKLTNWIKVHLVSNPFGVQYCLTQGRRLSLLGQDKRTREDKIISPKSSFMATNVHLNVGSKKLVILSEICKRTLAQNSKTLHGSTLKLYRCHYCYLYLFPPFRAVTVNNCKGTTLVLGPVATTLHITNSKNLTVIAVSRRICVSNSHNIKLFILTPTRPLILGVKNQGVWLAPYNTHYPLLEQQMLEAGIGLHCNRWSEPLFLVNDMKEENSVTKLLLPPSEFYLFTIPFEMDGPTKSIPGGIPSHYEEVLKSREEKLRDWQAKVQNASLTPEQQHQLQALVQEKFQVWLAATGHQRELESLGQYMKHCQSRKIEKKKKQKDICTAKPAF